jgi:hypothetical protein
MPIVVGMRHFLHPLLEMDCMRGKLLSTVALGAVLALGACGDDNGPGGDGLTQQEQTALITALSTEGTFTGYDVLALSPLFGNAEVGSVGDFAAVASQVKITVISDEGTESITSSAVTGWKGLNTGANSVDASFSVAAANADGTIPGTITSASIPDDNAFAFYFDGASDSHYTGTSGQFTVSGTDFGGYQDCNQYEGNHGGVAITECRYAIGTMTGNFDYVADRLASESGPESFTQSNVSYDLPAVQLLFTIDLRGLSTKTAATK